jgi:hypothetical protein
MNRPGVFMCDTFDGHSDFHGPEVFLQIILLLILT